MRSSQVIVTSLLYILRPAFAQIFVQYSGGGALVERADAITNPGTISGHLHDIFGSNAFNSNSTYDQLISDTTCTTVGESGPGAKGNSADKSAYWVPALYMKAKTTGELIYVPIISHVIYYEDSGNEKTIPIGLEFPKGWRAIAGFPGNRSANANTDYQKIIEWWCHDDPAPNKMGGFPTTTSACKSYPYFNAAIHFPHCWNGQDFDPANPFSHASYPDGDIQTGTCPSTHPMRVPHIKMENGYDTASVFDLVEPNSYTVSHGDPTGFGMHGDFMNGWEEGALSNLFKTCPQGGFGNHDIGTCGSGWKPYDTATSDCKLKTDYVEDYGAGSKPLKVLPGCNPVSTVGGVMNPVASINQNCNGGTVAPPTGGSNAIVGGGSAASSAAASSGSAAQPSGSSGGSPSQGAVGVGSGLASANAQSQAASTLATQSSSNGAGQSATQGSGKTTTMGSPTPTDDVTLQNRIGGRPAQSVAAAAAASNTDITNLALRLNVKTGCKNKRRRRAAE